MTSAKHLSQSGPDKDREEKYLCHRLCVKIQVWVERVAAGCYLLIHRFSLLRYPFHKSYSAVC